MTPLAKLFATRPPAYAIPLAPAAPPAPPDAAVLPEILPDGPPLPPCPGVPITPDVENTFPVAYDSDSIVPVL